jgi:hypothetical protein
MRPLLLIRWYSGEILSVMLTGDALAISLLALAMDFNPFDG